MHISRRRDAPEGAMEATHFHGSVGGRDHGRIEAPPGRALLVRFPAGARTHWHRHRDGQVLYVTEGSGRVGTRDGVEEVNAGDLVVAAPGEEHWHGAAADASVEHLALSFGDTEWAAPVEE